jgi:hypothetical protein
MPNRSASVSVVMIFTARDHGAEKCDPPFIGENVFIRLGAFDYKISRAFPRWAHLDTAPGDVVKKRL